MDRYELYIEELDRRVEELQFKGYRYDEASHQAKQEIISDHSDGGT